ncbi:MAG: hypothetical protein AAGB51_01725 [Planctomycetota bacterium]
MQNVRQALPLLRAVHGNDPTILGEDFAGTAQLSSHWVGVIENGRSIAVDLDPETLNLRDGDDRIERIVGDVRTATNPGKHACDVLFVGNFSIGEIHDRAALIEYLKHCRARTKARGGVLCCDTYGGADAFLPVDVHRSHPHPYEPGTFIRYTWEQREADPLTGRVINALHFRVERSGTIEEEFTDAFIYDWRLWSVPELRDAMHEAGFEITEVYSQLPDAVDDEGNAYVSPVTDPDELDDSFFVLVAAR